MISLVNRWLGAAAPAPPMGPGDDCAVLPKPARRQLVTVDPVILGRHFTADLPPALAGAKLFNRNASDIAAMGGTPRHAVLSLACAPRLRTAWLAGFTRGLARAALRAGSLVVGGDVAQAPEGVFCASLTLIGDAPHGRILTRTGARPGDWLLVSGPLGGSLLGRHARFRPLLAEGAWLAARSGVRSCIDLSDGLAKDVRALVPHGARPMVLECDVPVSAAARRISRSSGRKPLAHALMDGEDYELLFAVDGTVDPHAFAAEWKKRFGRAPHVIGSLVPAKQPRSAGEVDWDDCQGYEHLRTT